MIPIHDENPVSITPFVTYGLIACCVATYAYQMSMDSEALTALVKRYGVVPAAMMRDITDFSVIVDRLLPLWSSAFLHGGPFHLAGNMLFLWIFGNNVEDAMGHVKFLIFYLLAAAAAMLVQAVPDSSSVVPVIGASGAISGVLGAYLLLFPTARVTLLLWLIVFIRKIKLPAAIVLIGWFLIQLVSSAAAPDAEAGGIAFNAHIGGFLAGMVLVVFLRKHDFLLYNPIMVIIDSIRSKGSVAKTDDRDESPNT